MDKNFIIFDIETDGLYDEVSKIHCLSYQKYINKEIVDRGTITSHEDIVNFFSQDAYFIGHNIIRYDIPVLDKLLGTNLEVDVIDTLGLSWYLYPNQKKHGLEWWGDYLGVKKPKIDDWENQTLENYIHRCESDVEINVRLFRFFFNYLTNMYDDFSSIMRIVGYANFKLDCLREQEMSGITLNIDKCTSHLNTLEEMFNEKRVILSDIMPKDLGTVIKSKPKVMYKKDGNLSHYGQKWVEETSNRGLNFDEVDCIREEPNPGSNDQLKTWLIRLNWTPTTFKGSFSKMPNTEEGLQRSLAKLKEQEKVGLVKNIRVESKGIFKETAQISLPFGGGICPSVKELYEVEPNLVELEGYFVIKHRIGIFKSYLKNLKETKVYATAHGFTNTMRLTHSEPAVNLPKPGVFYGKEVREVLTIPDDNYYMCGSDVSSLEDNTKQHYIYFYDPEYVEEMRIPGFDPHIDIGILAGLITQDEADFFKMFDNLSDEDKKLQTQEDKDKFKKIKKARGVAKTANFAATYGAGGPKIANTAKISLNEGAKLHSIYWKRNKAVKKTANACIIKTVEHDGRNQKWLYNPVSGFWMFLKADKDKFSTLNQSSGVYVFDSWLRKVRQNLKGLNIPVIMQYHDELLLICKKELKGTVDTILHNSMKEVNDEVHLNVKISVSTDWGTNYAECH